MASRTLVREKLRAKYRERQENEVAKRTVVMCARLRRSLPLCEAGQLNIAALVGRWIDGHYRKAGYSKKFRAEHEADILLHQTAKKAFDELGMKKLPTVKSLQEEYAKLLAEKKAAYVEYRTARDEMRELLLHKQNVDRMLGKNEREEEKKKEHDRQ